MAIKYPSERVNNYGSSVSGDLRDRLVMPEVMINGPAGRLEGRYHRARDDRGRIAIVLHPHPRFGGTMNNPIVHALHYMFIDRGFSVMRFNFRSVGRSQGLFDNGAGELSDAAAALDWLQSHNREARICWIAGVSFGAWISMQVLMRRPEISGFMSIAPLTPYYDFSFLAPCPASGLFVNGDQDKVALPAAVDELVKKLKMQKGIEIEHIPVEGANHFFEDRIDQLVDVCGRYLDERLKKEADKSEKGDSGD